MPPTQRLDLGVSAGRSTGKGKLKPATRYVGGPLNGRYENSRGTLVVNEDWRPEPGRPLIHKKYNFKTGKYE